MRWLIGGSGLALVGFGLWVAWHSFEPMFGGRPPVAWWLPPVAGSVGLLVGGAWIVVLLVQPELGPRPPTAAAVFVAAILAVPLGAAVLLTPSSSWKDVAVYGFLLVAAVEFIRRGVRA